MGKMNDVSRVGRTVVLVSHNMGAITQLCKRCILVDQGKILADGTSQVTVTKYLSSFGAAGASVNFESDTNPTSPAIVLGIWIADEDGRAIPIADVRKGFQIGIQILIRRKTTNLDVGFRIDNSLKVPLLTSHLADSEQISQGMDAGEHAFLVSVPGDFLAPDLYSLTVALHRPNVEIYDWHEHALKFRVEESGSKMWQYESSAYGNILVNFPWRRVTPQDVLHE
jgi:lipopolysaccharide transport system ATP-binding protein